MLKLFLFSFIFTLSFFGYSSELDSLRTAYTESPNDSLKSRVSLKIGDYYEHRRIDQAIIWGDRAVYHARKFMDEHFLMIALNYNSTFYHTKGDYRKQVNLCLEALKIAEKLDIKESEGIITGNLGAAYTGLKDDEQAIKWLIRSIEIKEKLDNPERLMVSIANLGNYYIQLEDYKQGLVEEQRAVLLAQDLHHPSLNSYRRNAAICHLMLGQYQEALNLLNLAYVYYVQDEDEYHLNKIYLEYSWLYEKKNDFQTAILYADSAYQLGLKLKYPEIEHDAAIQLGTLHKKVGNNSKAYDYMLVAYNLWQEMNEEKSIESLNELRTQYETDAKQNEILLLKKDGEIKDLNLERNTAQIGKQRTIIFGTVGGIFILGILVYFLNKLNRDKRKKNDLLFEQKKLVEEKNKEIMASIKYAKRIQAAILPQKENFRKVFPESFVIYKPKDVVAGDFYWLEKSNNTTLFAVADCTGHGVPGAMVSVVCNNGLNRSVREHKLLEPGEILDKTREIVVEEFEKSEEEVKDGMDIALCSIQANRLKYSGANNPLWIVRNGGLIILQPNKQPVGKSELVTPFTTNSFELEQDDMIYLFSDGYADQFGGDKGKKFKTSNLKKLLLEVALKPVTEQQEIIDSTFLEWKEKEEQVDDVCLVGIRYS